MRHCCFRCVLSFLASLSMELQKTKSFWLTKYTWPKKTHYSEPSKQLYYSESRLLMDYPFEKRLGLHVLKECLVKDRIGLRHCCFRCVLSFLASLSMELQKTRKTCVSPSTPGQKKIHYSEPSKQFYYSESRLLMDYPFEKMIGGMF